MDATDAQLMERWRAGDRAAGAALFERYYDTVELFFANKVRVAVGDLVQETFRRLLEKGGSLRDSSKFRSFLFAIAYNVFKEHLRSKRRHGALDLDEVSIEQVQPGPRSLLAERQEQRLLVRALRAIPVNDQTVLELYYWEGMTALDLAEVLSIPEGTAKGRLQRARKKLRQAITKLCDSPQLLETTLGDLDRWARGIREDSER